MTQRRQVLFARRDTQVPFSKLVEVLAGKRGGDFGQLQTVSFRRSQKPFDRSEVRPAGVLVADSAEEELTGLPCARNDPWQLGVLHRDEAEAGRRRYVERFELSKNIAEVMKLYTARTHSTHSNKCGRGSKPSPL